MVVGIRVNNLSSFRRLGLKLLARVLCVWVTSLALALHHIGGRFGLGRSSISFAPCGESEQGRTWVHPSLVDSFNVYSIYLTLNLKARRTRRTTVRV